MFGRATSLNLPSRNACDDTSNCKNDLGGILTCSSDRTSAPGGCLLSSNQAPVIPSAPARERDKSEADEAEAETEDENENDNDNEGLEPPLPKKYRPDLQKKTPMVLRGSPLPVSHNSSGKHRSAKSTRNYLSQPVRSVAASEACLEENRVKDSDESRCCSKNSSSTLSTPPKLSCTVSTSTCTSVTGIPTPVLGESHPPQLLTGKGSTSTDTTHLTPGPLLPCSTPPDALYNCTTPTTPLRARNSQARIPTLSTAASPKRRRSCSMSPGYIDPTSGIHSMEKLADAEANLSKSHTPVEDWSTNFTVRSAPSSPVSGHSHTHERPLKTIYSSCCKDLFSSSKRTDAWDEMHVRLPCSPRNMVRTDCLMWPFICTLLSQPIGCSHRLEEIIFLLNVQYKAIWDMGGLHEYCINVYEPHACAAHNCLCIMKGFSLAVGQIASLVCKLPALVTSPISLLRKTMKTSVVLSQLQIASLLANCFFCTFPRRNALTSDTIKTEYSDFPSVNFSTLYQRHAQHKLRFIFHYFERVPNLQQCDVKFTRHHLSTPPDWRQSSTPLGNLVPHLSGSMEESVTDLLPCDSLLVDFANKKIGGGVLGKGSAQEETLFLTHPELLVSRLLCEELNDTECVIITGAERFSRHSGYLSELSWQGPYNDSTPRNGYNRRRRHIVAMDALDFNRGTRNIAEFSKEGVERELNKAYCAFSYTDDDIPPDCKIVTGHWGCGVFGGSRHLKSMIQYLASSHAGRTLHYHTQDYVFDEELQQVVTHLRNRRVTVGQLWTAIIAFCQEVPRVPKASLFHWIIGNT
ncbi:poly glycohydrolase family protein [Pelomyxa schiedti]|nr:poly glycohydrolase family protein [Pelomyxa schiedti]